MNYSLTKRLILTIAGILSLAQTLDPMNSMREGKKGLFLMWIDKFCKR